MNHLRKHVSRQRTLTAENMSISLVALSCEDYTCPQTTLYFRELQRSKVVIYGYVYYKKFLIYMPFLRHLFFFVPPTLPASYLSLLADYGPIIHLRYCRWRCFRWSFLDPDPPYPRPLGRFIFRFFLSTSDAPFCGPSASALGSMDPSWCFPSLIIYCNQPTLSG